MGRIAYVNGRYVPHREAAVHIEDRGYQFADGVYEVIAVYRGHLVDEQGHLDRLRRSLSELEIGWPVSEAVLPGLMREMIRRNRIDEGIIYLQVTRGVAPRDHAFPARAKPALVMTARAKDLTDLMVGPPVRVISVPDIRWGRPDIKSVSLLPNCLAKQQAHEAGCYEAWMVDREGWVTEGTSSNAWIVTANGELVTRKADMAILNGITRIALIELVRRFGVDFIERPFTVAEAKEAREAFLTSTTSFVKPVVEIDAHPIGDGRTGELTKRLIAFFTDHVREQAEAA